MQIAGGSFPFLDFHAICVVRGRVDLSVLPSDMCQSNGVDLLVVLCISLMSVMLLTIAIMVAGAKCRQPEHPCEDREAHGTGN